MDAKISRRDALRLSGLALGGLAVGHGAAVAAWDPLNPPSGLAEQNTLFKSLKPFYPGEALAADEMRISFMGTSPLLRRTQVMSSVFVELGNGDCFVFDCGAGATVNYNAMKIAMSKMRKIFLTHLHGDHTSDLTEVYGFGPQGDGKSPLYIWGPSASGVPDPDNGIVYDDGTLNFCQHFREMNRWHTEAQSFVQTRWIGAEGDGYDIFATELNWKTGDSSRHWTTNSAIPIPNSANWVAYNQNGVMISFFPAVHDRSGSISYKLEWNGLSMIFSGDTKPNQFMIDNASNGSRAVDVLIHEMVVPSEVWAARLSGVTDPSDPLYQTALNNARAVQENSHTPEKAFGYILNETLKRGKGPRLAVATHFQASDDTMRAAFDDIRVWYNGPVTIVTDLTVINVSKSRIEQRRAVVSDFAWGPPPADSRRVNGMYDPKYKDLSNTNPYKPMAPLAQFDPWLLQNVINPCLYDPSGYACTHPYGAMKKV